MEIERRENLDFIRTQIDKDLATGVHGTRVATRFPPEPNGWLHIGHAKSICLNFDAAAEHGGVTHLRFDDTNPETEDMRYVEAIQADIRWLGFDWGEHLYFASDYFEQLYEMAVQLINEGRAYVDDLTEDEIREYRGTVTVPGKDSPYRNRSVEENLELFDAMKAGEFAAGTKVLRAKIDMAHPNMKMRDPLMYRIRYAHHYRTGNEWCIYPFYDWAHGQSDAIEDITHSICTLEFENNRALYDWYLESLGYDPRPHQFEFAKLIIEYTVTAKRKLLQLVGEGHVAGWDDPRMPTLAGMRRLGYTAEAIRTFVRAVGVARVDSVVEYQLLEHYVRDDLNQRAPRVLAVLRPLKVVITNFPQEETEWLEASYWPHDVPKEGTRKLPFTRELFIEQSDFMEVPVSGFRRLTPGGEVRLRHGYIIRCDEVVKDEFGEVVELRCTYDPGTRSGSGGGRRAKGTIHWVAAEHAIPAVARLYQRLYTVPNPNDAEEGKTFIDYLNPNSVEVIEGVLLEPSLAEAEPGDHFQFERNGYFVVDTIDSTPDALVFNRIVPLRDSWKPRQPAGETVSRVEKGKTDDGPVVIGTGSDVRQQARAAVPVLTARYARYQEKLGLTESDADMLTGELAVAEFFDAALATYENPKTVANWVINEVLPLAKEGSLDDLAFSAAQVGALAALVDGGVISRGIGVDLLAEMAESGADPDAIVEAKGLRKIDDADALASVVDQAMAANPDKVAEYRGGKRGLLGFFTGQVMRATGGKADAKLVQGLLWERLEG